MERKEPCPGLRTSLRSDEHVSLPITSNRKQSRRAASRRKVQTNQFSLVVHVLSNLLRSNRMLVTIPLDTRHTFLLPRDDPKIRCIRLEI